MFFSRFLAAFWLSFHMQRPSARGTATTGELFKGKAAWLLLEFNSRGSRSHRVVCDWQTYGNLYFMYRLCFKIGLQVKNRLLPYSLLFTRYLDLIRASFPIRAGPYILVWSAGRTHGFAPTE